MIMEPRFATATLSAAGDLLKFDEIGCMALHGLKSAEPIRRRWVHDYSSEAWIDANSAFFVYADKLATPMGYGLAAFSSREATKLFLRKQQGRLVTFGEIRTIVQAKADYSNHLKKEG